jgi:DtxR family Mn-dependent transcriptional regulator
LLALVDVDVGDVVRIRQVGDRDPERLRYLAELGVTPGADVRVVARAPFGGPITLQIVREGSVKSRTAGGAARRARESAIGPMLAAQVFVETRRTREA